MSACGQCGASLAVSKTFHPVTGAVLSKVTQPCSVCG
jgi:hypothetical protein